MTSFVPNAVLLHLGDLMVSGMLEKGTRERLPIARCKAKAHEKSSFAAPITVGERK
jgi:mRNA-degrading endonuclease toxin of MazEF toxin-antitoxin module